MKRGQVAVIAVIVLIVIAVAGLLIFSQKRAGKAYEAPAYVPVSPVIVPEPAYYPPVPVPSRPVYTAPVGKAYVPPPEPTPPAEGPCIAEDEATTCRTARLFAAKKCLPKKKCETLEMFSIGADCHIKVMCT